MTGIQSARQPVNRSQTMRGPSASGPPHNSRHKAPSEQRRDTSDPTADRKPFERGRNDVQTSSATTNQATQRSAPGRMPPQEPVRDSSKAPLQSRPRAHSKSEVSPAANSPSAITSASSTTNQDRPLLDHKGLRDPANSGPSKIPRGSNTVAEQKQTTPSLDTKGLGHKAATRPAVQPSQTQHAQPDASHKTPTSNTDARSGPLSKPEPQAGKRGAASLAPPHNKSRPVTPTDTPHTTEVPESEVSKSAIGKPSSGDHRDQTDSAKHPRRTKTPQPEHENASRQDPQASARGTASASHQQPLSRPTSPSGASHTSASAPHKKDFVPKERVANELSRVRPYSDGFFEGAMFSSKFKCTICHPHGGPGAHYENRVGHYRQVHALFCKKCGPSGGSLEPEGFSPASLAAHLRSVHSEEVQVSDLASIVADAMHEQKKKIDEAAKERREKMKEAQRERVNAAKARHEGHPISSGVDQQEHAGDSATGPQAAPQSHSTDQKANAGPLHGQVT